MISRYYPFTLTLRAPLLATELGGDSNSATSALYVPGSAIRGAVARAVSTDAATLHEFILSSAVRYLNAYPVESKARALPAPRSLRAVKGARPEGDGSVNLYDLAAFSGTPDEQHSIDGVWPEDDLVAADMPFLVHVGSRALRAEVRTSSHTHQQRDRTRGHSWKQGDEEHGTIYSYEAINPGQRFRGMLLINGADEAEVTHRFERLRDFFPDPLLLGRSRRAGYGGDVAVEWEHAREREVEDWPTIKADIAAGTKFRALLTAPYLGRDQENGQPDPAALLPELLKRLGNHSDAVRCTRVAFFGVNGVAGGYNRTWGMPLPQALTVAAGSLVLLEAKERILFSTIEAIEHAGLGERRNEGFGRICFLAGAYERKTVDRPAAKVERPDRPVSDLARQIQGRVFQGRLQREIAARAAQLARDATSPPSTALLGRLRTGLQGAPGTAPQTLATWLGDGEHALRPSAMRQLERCRITVNGSTTTLRNWLRQPPDAQQLSLLLRLPALAQQTAFDPDQSALTMSDPVAESTWLGLVEATLEAMARRNRARERADDGHS